MFDLTACFVERTNDDNYRVQWRCSEPGLNVSLYISDDAEPFYHDQPLGTPLLTTSNDYAIVPNPDKKIRHYFYLQSERGEGVVLGERKLALEGTANFRDLGGYIGDEGRQLKWGKLYRSSKLSGLTDNDIHYMRNLGVTLICDFRQVIEQELEPSRLCPLSPPSIASLPITPGSSTSFMQNLHNGIIAVDDAAGFMQTLNRDLVSNQMPQYAEMFRLLLNGDQQLLIHCASGKDRTGFGAALILDVLGVDQEQILEDYLLTNQYLPIDEEVNKLANQLKDHSGAPVSADVLRPMMEVRPEYLKACFDEIRQRYQSREHFFETALNLDKDKINTLKNRYLHD